MSHPLEGVRILELGQIIAGTYGAQVLSDLGAEVIKIEAPEGDLGRIPSVAPYRGISTLFLTFNRNKQSVCLDLRSEAGRQRLGELVANSHALLVNMKPSAIKRLGLTYEALRGFNDRIVCVAMTGFGLDGGDDPAFDYVIQAATGVAAGSTRSCPRSISCKRTPAASASPVWATVCCPTPPRSMVSRISGSPTRSSLSPTRGPWRRSAPRSAPRTTG